MKKIIISITALSLLSLSTAYYVFSENVTPFTSDQQANIGKIAADYLIEHPEFLIEASKKLELKQKKQQANVIKNAVLTNKDALLNDATTPFAGPKTAKVNVIEFFDYQCIYCAKVSPAIEKMQKEFPNVKFIYG